MVMDFVLFKGSKVLVTGNTGFKGSWLTAWLKHLGATVIGVSKDIPTRPSMYEATNLADEVNQYFCDINEHDKLKKIVDKEKPDFVFHLAAQPIVSVSYVDPLGTIQSNALGSISVLKALEDLNHRCVVVMITSDKCYENVEWEWGYKETDQLGGKDMYSASKGAAEILISSYIRSIMSRQKNITAGIGRAGNVVGGGDWAKDRLMVDIVQKWSAGETAILRSPHSVRPWQHVLEPLSGYLTLAFKLYTDQNYNGEAFNFGPRSDISHTVEEIVQKMQSFWFESNIERHYCIDKQETKISEAGLLKLNCEKAGVHLNWYPVLAIEQTLRMVVDWYRSFYNNSGDIAEITREQIKAYERMAVNRVDT